jgi:lycopene cyclase domain-containing protein
VTQLLYLGLLAFCLIGTAPLELLLGVRVYRRGRKLLVAVLPAFLIGISWDAYAVHARQWRFDRRYLIGLRIGSLPIEEILFFLVIPVCAVLTLEAVRMLRPGWLDRGWSRGEP